MTVSDNVPSGEGSENTGISQDRLERYRDLTEEEYLGEVDPSIEPYVRATVDQAMNPSVLPPAPRNGQSSRASRSEPG